MGKNILVPYDGSEHADKALDLAADIALQSGATLHVVHALIHGHVPGWIRAMSDIPADLGVEGAPEEGFTQAELPRDGASGHVEPAQAPRNVLEDIAAKLLERAAQRVRERGLEQVDTAWHSGGAAEVILEQARARGADTIVMGSSGLSNLEGILIGSVSHKVAHAFDGTVVTVK
ncbi:MAG: universal stress protein [Halofilum sp. (in: g-proteobacteria)]|nr:universal stress protein [Halofilum sp. (in: g-proteobacteria)]